MRVCDRMLLEYLHRMPIRYENDLTVLLNNVQLRKADPVDHLEIIMAQTRAATADRIAGEVLQIMHVNSTK